MRRLVYSPNVHAYIKSDERVVDISPWIVSGSVNRKINQVSTAQITLRNPQNDGGGLLWTDHVRKDGTTGPQFHPMDPITIVMTRLKGHPVQVFTGYLDKAPYLQLYPGLCTIEASCTLKRLLYTQWDAALPFVQHFLAQYGWAPNPDNGIVNFTAESQQLVADAGTIQGEFNDGSIGALLFAVLNHVGGWDSSNIWIEALPPQIKTKVLQLWKEIAPGVQQDSDRFKTMISTILGSQSAGTGAPGGVSTGGTGPVWRVRASAEDSRSGNGWTELSTNGNGAAASGRTQSDCCLGNSVGCCDFATLGRTYPHGTMMKITDVQSGGSAVLPLTDIGNGSSFAPAIGLTPNAQAAIRWSGGDVLIQLANGQDLSVASGFGRLVSSGPSAGGKTTGGSTPSSSPQPIGPVHATNQPVTANAAVAGTSPGGRSGSPSSTTTTRYDVIVEAANAINGMNFPYVWGGGHTSVGVPNGSPPGFDCSGAVSAVLYAAGLVNNSFTTADEVATVGSNMAPGLDQGANAVNIFVKNIGGSNDHTFMQIGGRYFGTSGVVPTDPAGGAGWFHGSPGASYLSGFQQFHIPQNLLAQTTGNRLPKAAGGPGGSATVPGGSGGGSGGGGDTAVGAAFSTFINLPGVFDQATALLFSGRRSFMADQPLFPFIEQLCQASMRSFMSMPNGNFFAFFPDYFGIYGRKYYWEIEDLEIIDGRIDLSDDPLVTHVAVAGDVTQYHQTVDVFDLLRTSGIFTIFDAFQTDFLTEISNRSLAGRAATSKTSKAKGKTQTQDGYSTDTRDRALAFLQKYGARPLVQEVVAIRSPFFELFYAFQKFMLLWAKQFQTTFELTFMPEIFPGGIVAFPTHHLQCFVEEVAHSWDYEQGFTTTVALSAPSIIEGDAESRNNLSAGLARPLPAFVSSPDHKSTKS